MGSIGDGAEVDAEPLRQHASASSLLIEAVYRDGMATVVTLPGAERARREHRGQRRIDAAAEPEHGAA